MKARTRLSLALVLLFVVMSLAACTASKEETSVPGQLTEILNELYPEDDWNIASQMSVNRSVQTFSDAEGNQILFYTFQATALIGEVDDEQLYQLLLEQESVENGEPCQVGTYAGLSCVQGERAYLCWSPAEATVLILEYDPLAVSEADILHMAESAEPETEE